MKLAEALTECVSGARMTATHMQPGCYIEHLFSKGFVRCWPVDRPEDEPNRTQCEFRSNDSDEAADWVEVEQPVPKPSPWGTFAPGLPAEPEPVKAEWGGARSGKTDALAQVGFILPGATLVIDIDETVPKRDSWGRIIP